MTLPGFRLPNCTVSSLSSKAPLMLARRSVTLTWLASVCDVFKMVMVAS